MAKFYNRLLVAQIIILLLMFGLPKLMAAEQSAAWQTYSIQYDVIAKKKTVGQASRSLEQLSNGQWQIAMQSKVKYLFLSDKRKETSRFELVDGQIVPLHYQRLTDTSLKSDTSLIQQFDWSTDSETGSYKGKNWNISVPHGSLDQLTQLLAVREKVIAKQPIEPIDISYRGQIRKHQFTILGEETIDTAKGKVTTIKVQLNEAARKRQTNFWLATEYNMLPIKIQRIKKGKEEARLIATNWQ